MILEFETANHALITTHLVTRLLLDEGLYKLFRAYHAQAFQLDMCELLGQHQGTATRYLTRTGLHTPPMHNSLELATKVQPLNRIRFSFT